MVIELSDDNERQPVVSFIPNVPLSFGLGGLELQMIRSMDALIANGVRVEKFEYWNETLQVDLLHLFGGSFNQIELVLRAAGRQIPLVITSMFVRTSSKFSYDAWSLADKFFPISTTFGLRKSVLKRADAVICISEYEARDVNRWFGVPRDRIHVIANGVDNHFFTATPDLAQSTFNVKDFVLCVGSVEPLKQQHIVIEACRKANRPLVLIGTPKQVDTQAATDYTAKIERMVSESDSVIWVKGLDHSDPLLASAYAASRMHVLPTLTEAQGIVSLEAAAAGSIVVMSDLPNLREIFGTDAWYAMPGSVDSFATVINDAWDSKPTYRERKPTWLKSWAEVAEQLAAVYKSVLSSAIV
ncbi:MAG: glycosyltransferase family 4 protein [Ignavibacteria bacterium]|nr:glycosyltransferase family 4 protein [Ignavibacteria bacterium]